jgi:hypothetical protein
VSEHGAFRNSFIEEKTNTKVPMYTFVSWVINYFAAQYHFEDMLKGSGVSIDVQLILLKKKGLEQHNQNVTAE